MYGSEQENMKPLYVVNAFKVFTEPAQTSNPGSGA